MMMPKLMVIAVEMAMTVTLFSAMETVSVGGCPILAFRRRIIKRVPAHPIHLSFRL